MELRDLANAVLPHVAAAAAGGVAVAAALLPHVQTQRSRKREVARAFAVHIIEVQDTLQRAGQSFDLIASGEGRDILIYFKTLPHVVPLHTLGSFTETAAACSVLPCYKDVRDAVVVVTALSSAHRELADQAGRPKALALIMNRQEDIPARSAPGPGQMP